MTKVADEKKAQIMSISYGDDEANQGTAAMEAENSILAQLTGEGITVLASSGDQGAYGRGPNGPYNVADPSSQPFVTAVGGTTLFTDGSSNYLGEQVWNELASHAGAKAAWLRPPEYKSVRDNRAKASRGCPVP